VLSSSGLVCRRSRFGPRGRRAAPNALVGLDPIHSKKKTRNGRHLRLSSTSDASHISGTQVCLVVLGDACEVLLLCNRACPDVVGRVSTSGRQSVSKPFAPPRIVGIIERKMCPRLIIAPLSIDPQHNPTHSSTASCLKEYETLQLQY